MTGRRADQRAADMFERYCDGLTLAEVGAEYDVTRQTVWKMFERRGLTARDRAEELARRKASRPPT